MMRSFVIAAAGCFVAASLAACGGHTGTSVVPASHHSSGAVRHVRSVCTPDSYGYCYVKTSDTVHGVHCSPHYTVWLYLVGSRVYEVYQGDTDLGTYTDTYSGDCNSGTSDSWGDTGDPAVVYNDPNLP